MDSTICQASRSTYVVIGPEGATNFAIIKSANGRAILIDATLLGKTRMVERNINQFLTGRWY